MIRLNEIMKKIYCLLAISPDNFEHELFINIIYKACGRYFMQINNIYAIPFH